MPGKSAKKYLMFFVTEVRNRDSQPNGPSTDLRENRVIIRLKEKLYVSTLRRLDDDRHVATGFAHGFRRT